MKKTKDKRGITLIALILTIIVLLILAGVSLNALVGDNGVITNAQVASLKTRYAKYKEELEINMVGDSSIDDSIDLENMKVTAIESNLIKKYIPSIEENDIQMFSIIKGKLYFTGDDEISKQAATSQGIEVVPEDMTVDEFVKNIENLAVEEMLKKLGGKAFTNSEGVNSRGVELLDKNFDNGNNWKIITKIENGKAVAVYGTGWYYVEAGTNVENIGVLKNSYIINYDTEKAVRFRIWATTRLHEYIQKGFTIDDERLKQGGNRYVWAKNII